MIHSFAGGSITDTGPLTKKRMETIDEEVNAKAFDFMERAKKADKPFFLWWNSTRMHIFTHLKKESVGKTGLGIYPDGMVEHDGHVGQMLDKLKELGLEDNTIVMYSTDNGAESMSWPMAVRPRSAVRRTPNGRVAIAYRAAIRWPGVIKPGTIINEIGSHEDMLTTLLAAAGEPDVKDKLLKGHKAIGRDYKVYLDGYDLGPALKGEAAWPRVEFLYWTDDGNAAALRLRQWKISFLRQDAHGLAVWQMPFLPLRAPMICNLRADPLERAEYEGMDYNRWFIEHAFAVAPAAMYVGRWLQSFREFPPRQKPGSFNLDHVMEQVTKAHGQ